VKTKPVKLNEGSNRFNIKNTEKHGKTQIKCGKGTGMDTDATKN